MSDVESLYKPYWGTEEDRKVHARAYKKRRKARHVIVEVVRTYHTIGYDKKNEGDFDFIKHYDIAFFCRSNYQVQDFSFLDYPKVNREKGVSHISQVIECASCSQKFKFRMSLETIVDEEE